MAQSIPANLGVNPSLTITAMAERAMNFIPEAPQRPDSQYAIARKRNDSSHVPSQCTGIGC